jgi:hypothetical protein
MQLRAADNCIRLNPNHGCGLFRETIISHPEAVRDNDKVSSLDEATLSQLIKKSDHGRRIPWEGNEKAEAIGPVGILCTRREREYGRSA